MLTTYKCCFIVNTHNIEEGKEPIITYDYRDYILRMISADHRKAIACSGFPIKVEPFAFLPTAKVSSTTQCHLSQLVCLSYTKGQLVYSTLCYLFYEYPRA